MAREVTFTFTADEKSRFECQVDGGAWQRCKSRDGSFTFKAEWPPASHTFAVRATDGAGNVDPTPATRTWICVP